MTLDPYYDKTGSTLYHGECLNLMAEMEDNSNAWYKLILCTHCGVTRLDFQYGYWFCAKCEQIFQPRRVAMALLRQSLKKTADNFDQTEG